MISRAISFFVICLVVFGSCGRGKKSPEQSTPTLGKTSICVDETFRPIIEAEIDVFTGLYANTTIDAKYVPEQESFTKLLSGEVECIVASRPLSKQELEAFHQKKIYPKQTKVAYDAIALIVSPESTDTIISINQIRDVLSGKIKNWNQINPASKAGAIRVVFDNQNSGIVSYLVDSICGGKFNKSNLYALDYNRDVIEFVSKQPGVLGFIGGSWISNASDSLHLSFHKRIKVVAVSSSPRADSENSYQPFQAYLVDGIYPLTREIYMINAEPRNGLATGFTAFVASDKGQRIILKSGILPAIAPTRVVNVRGHI